jgi:hypothetical protein
MNFDDLAVRIKWVGIGFAATLIVFGIVLGLAATFIF